ncbi:hypothetical protein [Polaromonas sp. DSR2-3-2]|uniref:hypothetical protein n=1 Tax=unclassified Polaromonas TaxID=2638319 RepID=UPI003CED9625
MKKRLSEGAAQKQAAPQKPTESMNMMNAQASRKILNPQRASLLSLDRISAVVFSTGARHA